jgi:hypothetical protein
MISIKHRFHAKLPADDVHKMQVWNIIIAR